LLSAEKLSAAELDELESLIQARRKANTPASRKGK
jgi:hypothetical protein